MSSTFNEVVDPVAFLQVYLNAESDAGDDIKIKRITTKMTGNLNEAAILSRIMYWSEPDRNGRTRLRHVDENGELWLAKNHADWYEECAVDTRNAREALVRLKKKGIIETKQGRWGKGFAGRNITLIRLNAEGWCKAYQQAKAAMANLPLTSEEDEIVEVVADVAVKPKDAPENDPVPSAILWHMDFHASARLCQVDLPDYVRSYIQESLNKQKIKESELPSGSSPAAVSAEPPVTSHPVDFMDELPDNPPSLKGLPIDVWTVLGGEKIHLSPCLDLATGRLHRKAGEPLCRTRDKFKALSHAPGHEPTCAKCLEIANRFIEQGGLVSLRDQLKERLGWAIYGGNPNLKISDTTWSRLNERISHLLEMYPDLAPEDFERALAWYTLLAEWNTGANLPHNAETLTNGNWQMFVRFEQDYPNWFGFLERYDPNWREIIFTVQRKALRKHFEGYDWSSGKSGTPSNHSKPLGSNGRVADPSNRRTQEQRAAAQKGTSR